MKRKIALQLICCNICAILFIITALTMAMNPFKPCGFCEPEARATYNLITALSFGLGIALILGVPSSILLFSEDDKK